MAAEKPKETYLIGCLNMMCSDYSRYNTQDGKDEDANTRNLRWAQSVRVF
jgi:hypothetical protein